MPASIIEPINVALHTSLKNSFGNNLDKELIGSARKALLENIEFEAAGSYHNSVLSKLKSKYIVLKSTDSIPSCSKLEENAERLVAPKKELFPLESVRLGWANSGDWSVGSGMVNMGFTCYLNATLQALFHTPAFVNWLLSDEHPACQGAGVVCLICAMKKTLLESQQRVVGGAIRPVLIYNKERVICKSFVMEHQEDAHEFLRYLVEGMEKAYLGRFRCDLDSRSKETTPLNQILGGYLRSAVECLRCGHVSTTFQHFQDVPLDVRKAHTLDDALDAYFAREKLDDDTYRCSACARNVPATKQFSLERAPMVLCVQLKRFSGANTKISKHVVFRQRLDLSKYATAPRCKLAYRLVALITHVGPTVNCGHYTAVGIAPSGNYYQFDDSTVRPISHQGVFNTNAYVMFYELEFSPYSKSISNGAAKAKSTENSTSTSGLINFTNGIGFTSSKPYGPHLSPTNKAKLLNGNGTSYTCLTVNGNGKKHESDEKESETKRINGGKSKDDSSKNGRLSFESPSKEDDSDRKKKISSSNHKHKEDKSPTTQLVPYEMDDSSNESESSLPKASNSDWKVTSTMEPPKKNEGWKRSNEEAVRELTKMSHNGYSAPVSTWSGTRAHLDREVQSERREDRKRTVNELADPADQGRAKHAKTHNDSYKSNPGYNPIQEYHNSKNWNNGGQRYGKGFYNGKNRYNRRNFHHKNNYHSKHFRFK